MGIILISSIKKQENPIDKDDKSVWVCDLSLQQYKQDKVGRAQESEGAAATTTRHRGPHHHTLPPGAILQPQAILRAPLSHIPHFVFPRPSHYSHFPPDYLLPGHSPLCGHQWMNHYLITQQPNFKPLQQRAKEIIFLNVNYIKEDISFYDSPPTQLVMIFVVYEHY